MVKIPYINIILFYVLNLKKRFVKYLILQKFSFFSILVKLQEKFIHRLFSIQIQDIVKEKNYYTLYGQKIKHVEFVGVILEEKERYMKILDCKGTLQIYKDKSVQKVNGPCSFICNIFGKDHPLIFCSEIRKITVYEELFFWYENTELNQIRKN